MIHSSSAPIKSRPIALVCAALAAPLMTSVAAAQGTAALAPLFPDRGATATLSYDATDGPLETETAVIATVGFNGFENAQDITMTGSAPNWSAEIAVPFNATSIDVVFKDETSTTFDNNGGIGADWQFLVSDVLSVELGTTRLPDSEGGGYLFRLWAPDVSSASVIGDFNGFNGVADAMILEPTDGLWSAHVPNAETNQSYKFLLDETKFRRDPRGRQIRGGFNDSVLVDPSEFTFQHPRPGTNNEFRDWVIYQVHIGTLDPASGSAPGRFVDLIPERLDYIKSLNFNAIKVMPINEFDSTTSGGYNLSDPFAIERDYGTPDEFRQFVDACHERGIAVILDVVHNHYGPSGLDIFDFQDLGDDGVNEPGIYFYDSPPALADTAFGPRPDYSQEQVQLFIKDNIRQYLDEYNLDGYRWDFTKGIRGTLNEFFGVDSDIPEGVQLLQEINTTTLAQPNIISIAEDLDNDPRITSDVAFAGGNPNDGFGFDSQWVTGFHFGLVDQLTRETDSELNMNTVAGLVNGSFKRVHYLESHDEVWELNEKDRVPTRIDSADPESLRSRKMSSLGAGVLLTTAGMPMVFQGSELLDIGGPDGNNSWDDNEAIDFSRLSDPNIAAFNEMYGDLVALRRNLFGSSAGLLGDNTNVFNVDNSTKAIAYSRSNGFGAPGDTVVVLANFSNIDFESGYDIGLPSPGTWYEIFNSDSTEYGPDYGNVGVEQVIESRPEGQHGFGQRGTVRIGARSFVVLSQVPNEIVETEIDAWRVF